MWNTSNFSYLSLQESNTLYTYLNTVLLPEKILEYRLCPLYQLAIEFAYLFTSTHLSNFYIKATASCNYPSVLVAFPVVVTKYLSESNSWEEQVHLTIWEVLSIMLWRNGRRRLFAGISMKQITEKGKFRGILSIILLSVTHPRSPTHGSSHSLHGK